MRHSDHVVKHIKDKGSRLNKIEHQAKQSGFSSASDYIDHTQQRSDTKSFTGKNGRIAWMNKNEGLFGWNNLKNPEKSTAYPVKPSKINGTFNRKKIEEADKLRVSPSKIEEKGALTKNQRITSVREATNNSSTLNKAPARKTQLAKPEAAARSAADTEKLRKAKEEAAARAVEKQNTKGKER